MDIWMEDVVRKTIMNLLITVDMNVDKPIRVAPRTKACTMLTRSNAGVLRSNSTRGVSFFVLLFCLCCPSCR
jgi:hypothetical protein